MPPIRQVGQRQLEILLEFVEKNRKLVLANTGRTPFCQRQANRAWEEVALRLNSIGDGVSKTPVDWKRYWHLLKCRTKAKAANVWRGLVGTIGGPNKLIPLSDIEERIVAIIGKVSVESISKSIQEPQPSYSPSSPIQTEAPGLSIETDTDSSNIKVKLEEEEDECKVEVDCFIEQSASADPLAAPAPRFASNSAAPAPSTVPVPSIAPVITAVSVPSVTPVRTAVPVPSVVPLRTAVPVPSLAPAHSPVPAPSTEPVFRDAPSPAQMPSDESASSAEETRPYNSKRSSRPRRNRDQNMPGWAYILEQRRIATEERLVEEIADLNTTNRGILGCMQQIVQLLEGHLAQRNN